MTTSILIPFRMTTLIKQPRTEAFELMESNRQALGAINRASGILAKYDVKIPEELLEKTRQLRDDQAKLVTAEAESCVMAQSREDDPRILYGKLQLLKPYL